MNFDITKIPQHLQKGFKRNKTIRILVDFVGYEVSNLPKEQLDYVFKRDLDVITNSLKKYGFDEFAEKIRNFKSHRKKCPNCNLIYEIEKKSSKFQCPNCIDYNEEKNKARSDKIVQSSLENDSYKSRAKKISKSLKSKSPEEWRDIKQRAIKTTKEKYGDDFWVKNTTDRWVSRTLEEKQKIGQKISQTKLNWTEGQREHFKQALQQTWAAKSPEELKEIQSKADKTSVEKYGYPKRFDTLEVREQIKQTNIKKYGVPNPLQAPLVRAKRDSSMIEKYGARFALQVEEFKEKAKQTSIKNFGASSHTQKHILHYENYENPVVWRNFTSSKEACNYFGICIEQARFKLYEYNPEIVKNRSLSQTLLFSKIHSQDKIQNTKSIISPLELDIYLPDIRLAVEFDGLMYHSQGLSNHQQFNTPNFDKLYHLNKTLKCKEQGIQLFHIFEGEDLDLWLSMIHNRLGINTKIYARKCYIREIKSSETIDFLKSNHIQGYCKSKINIGLYLNTPEGEKLVSLMTFSKPRFNKSYDYELIRFCSLKHHNVIGAASKLWKYFLKKYHPKSVISYANLRFSSGGVYEKLGFSLIRQTDPNYFYFKDSTILEPRVKYQKHKLKNYHLSGKLSYFNENETEVQNMFKNGYRRIFDCGNLVYEYTGIV